MHHIFQMARLFADARHFRQVCREKTAFLHGGVQAAGFTHALMHHGKSARCTVLVDSGNLLRDPLTGRDVILLSRDAVAGLGLPAGEEAYGAGEHLLPVPASGVHGTRLLWALRPEMLLVNGTARDALVAAERVPADHYGGFSGTCPVSLV